MKRIMALLLATAMLLAMVTVTAGASEATTEIANFDIDTLGLENGGDIIEASIYDSAKEAYTGRFKYNGTGYFLYVDRSSDSNVGITAYGEKDVENQTAKISFAEDAYYWASFRMLKNSVNGNRDNDAAITARTSDVAYTFDLKMVEGINFRVSAKGLPSTATSVKGDDGKYITEGYLTSTLFEIANGTGTTLKTNSYTKDTTDSPVAATYTDKFARGENVNFKVIVDYDEGTFDLYVNNHLVAADNGLAGTKFLSDFFMQIEHKDDYGAVETFIDNLSYRILSDNDLKQVYLSDDIENGTLTLNETFTEIGKSITFTAIPDEGYKLSSLTLDGKEIEGLSFTGKGGTYTIESLPYGGELKAVFEEKRTTALVAEFDADNYDVASGEIFVDKGTTRKAFSLNECSNFMTVTTQGNALITADGAENKEFKIYGDKGKYSSATIYALRNDVNTTRTDKQKEIRTNDIAMTFRVKLNVGTAMTVSAMGVPSTATLSKNASGYWISDSSFVASNILSCGRSGAGGYTYSYTDAGEETKTNYDGIVSHSDYKTYKIIFDYDAGTYDLYVDDYLISADNNLNGMKYLSDFKVSVHHQSGYSGSYDLDAYLDDFCIYTLAEEDTKIQTSVVKSGNGTVACDKFLIAEGDTVNYTITPAEGSYVRNVSVNGEAAPAFSANGTAWKIENVTSANTLQVEFGEYGEGLPAVMISPLAAREDNTTYLFCKLLSNGAEVEGYGILLSRTNELPAMGDEATIKLPFFGEAEENGEPKDVNGYFGFALNDTSMGENPDFYARPYAVVNGEYVYGSVRFIEPELLTVIE